ncbi:MAG: mannose-6-phosphate isomerase, class I [Treponemataceae bacterium]|nr:MAG: mannose-6-phosphate isomerase, class I [Treponemataceae bacterium]
MLKLEPFVSKKIWGYENWCVSEHPAGASIPAGVRRGRGEYPIIVKVIQANQPLSVQVHPDDEYARVREHCAGKFECWYVLDAAPGAELVAGIKPYLTKDDVRTALARGSIEDALYKVGVEKGSFVVIPPGLVHAIGGGIRLLEVQQSSDITYRFYDWGRGRELHIEKAFDVLKPLAARTDNFLERFPEGTRFSSPYFSLELIEHPATIDCAPDTVLFALDGSGTLAAKNGETQIMTQKEDAVFFPSDETVTASGGLTLLRILPADDSCS